MRLCLRMPAGRRLQRSWPKDTPLRAVYDYVEAMCEEGELEGADARYTLHNFARAGGDIPGPHGYPISDKWSKGS